MRKTENFFSPISPSSGDPVGTIEKVKRVGEIAEVLSYGQQQYRDYSIWEGEEFLLVRDGRIWKQSAEPLPEPIFSPGGEVLAPSLEEARARTDATLLRGEETEESVREWAAQMAELRPRNVCVFPAHIEAVSASFPHPATVISFPHGASTLRGKIAEIEEAARAGAGEADVVAPLRLMNRDGFSEEIEALQKRSPIPLKVILETALWSEPEISEATAVLAEAGVFAAKTSTGTGDGASVEAVRAMRRADREIEIKASGGVRSRIDAGAMQRAGATMFGASNLQDWR